MRERRCHDCGCAVGEIHGYGCDVERCPFCHKQLISCNCIYEKLGVDEVTSEISTKFLALITTIGRIPYNGVM